MFNRKKRLRDEREECLHCKEKEIGGGRKKKKKILCSPTTARLTSLGDIIFLFQPIFCLFPLRTVEPAPRLMLVRDLFLSLLPFKSCC